MGVSSTGGMAQLAQPSVTAVTNAADFSFPVAPGSLATIFGLNLAPSALSAATLPLTTLLNGVSVSISGHLAPVYYVSPTQINFQIPYGTAAGTATVTVNDGGNSSNPLQFLVASSAIGIFRDGAGHGIVQNQDYSLNSSANRSVAGSTIIAYLTGIGTTRPALQDGVPAPSSPLAVPTVTATATIGDAAAVVQFIGMTPGSVGLAQANIEVPSLPSGDYPLTVSLNGHQSESALVSVSGSGTGFQVSSILGIVTSISVPNGVGDTLAPWINGLLGSSVALFGNYLYICGPPNIHVVDVSNPAKPTLVYEFGDTDLNGLGGACFVNTSGASPFLVDLVSTSSESIVQYDLSNPARPAKVSQIQPFPPVPGPGEPDVTGAAFSGRQGFFDESRLLIDASNAQVTGTNGYLVSVDFSKLGNPVAAPLLPYNPAQPATDPTHLKYAMFSPSPATLYAAGTTSSGDPNNGTAALDIFDIGNPVNVQGLAQVLVPGATVLQSLAVSGNELLAVGNTRGFLSQGNSLGGNVFDFPYTGYLTLTTFDITNPRGPVMQGNSVALLQPNGCSATALGGGFYALSCGGADLLATGAGLNNSLVVVDARDPKAPIAFTYASVQGLGGLAVSNGYLYAATATGANIYKIQLP
jgi:uncharacterized protein (TIGR03437 family)